MSTVWYCFINNEAALTAAISAGQLAQGKESENRISSPGSSAEEDGSASDIAHAAVKSLTQLCQFAADYGINVIVENHGGYSSRGSWLSSVIQSVGMARFTIPIWAQKN